MTLERQDGVPTLERGNDQGRAVERFFGPGEPAACRMHFAGMARSYYTTSQPGVKGGSGPYRDMRGNYPKQPFGAEPGGGVWNQEQGASCLSAASSCPAGSAPRRPGSSQRQGCPFAVVWRRPHDGFFSLGRQRKERLPARGAAGLVTLERQDGVPTLERGNDQKVVLLNGVLDLPGRPAACRMHFAGMARSYREIRRFRGGPCPR